MLNMTDKKTSQYSYNTPKHSMKKGSLNCTHDSTLLSRRSTTSITSKYTSSSRLTKSRIFQTLSRAAEGNKI